MKRNIGIISTFITVLICICTFQFTIFPVNAYNKDEHNDIMRQVLFKDSNNKLANPFLTKLDNLELTALENACYLTIDQYNGNGIKELEALKSYGVKDLPSDISIIDYKDGPYHRRKTHRGWDFVYANKKDQDRWIIRKRILLNTADKVFNFDGQSAEKDSFCALLYYTHILGDRIADHKYYQNVVIMDVGGRIDKEDICNELIRHIQVLFKDQKGTQKYSRLISKIRAYNERIGNIPISSSSQLTDEEFEEYQLCAVELLGTLELYIPKMLKSKSFFSDVFYKF